MLLIVLLSKIFVVQIINIFSSFLGWPLPSVIFYTISIQIFSIFFPALFFARNIKAETGVCAKDIFKIKKVSAKYLAVCAIIGCMVQSVTIIINAPIPYLLIKFFNVLPPMRIQAPENIQLYLIYIVIIAILPSFFEELLFRGILITTQEPISGSYGAVFISAIYFTIMHDDISTFLGIFLLGVVLGFAVCATGSLYSAMVMHFFYNVSGLSLQYISKSLYIANQEMFYILSALISIPVLIFGLYYLKVNSIMKINKGTFKQAFLNIPFILILLYYVLKQSFSLLTAAG